VGRKDEPKKDFRALGFVRLWRGFQDDPLYKKRRKFSQWEAWEWLMMNARGTDLPGDKPLIFHGHIVQLRRGQLATSQWELARRWGWSRGSVECFFRKLSRRKSISIKAAGRSGGYTIITLLNYEELNPK
jgi:hypothetical protein